MLLNQLLFSFFIFIIILRVSIAPSIFIINSFLKDEEALREGQLLEGLARQVLAVRRHAVRLGVHLI